MAITYKTDNYITNLVIQFKNDFNLSGANLGKLLGLNDKSCYSCMSHYLNGKLSVSNKKLKTIGIEVDKKVLKDNIMEQLNSNNNDDLLVEVYNRLYFDNIK